MTSSRPTLEHYLSLEYPYTVVPDDGSFFVYFPDLPGCMTQVEEPGEIAAMADEIRTLWLEATYEDGQTIPEPVTKEYSGKFVTRVPKSLHRDLAERAQREGMSLNAYVNYLLAERNVMARTESQIEQLRAQLGSVMERTVDRADEPQQRLLEEARQRRGLRLVYPEVVAV